jgi:hypothetical protein
MTSQDFRTSTQQFEIFDPCGWPADLERRGSSEHL